MSDEDEFDPSAAAARAVGDLADEDVGGDSGGSDPAPDPDAGGGSSDDVDSGDDSGPDSDSKGMLATIFLPLFLADEKGPTSSTFQNHDVPEGLSLMLDGATDYLLDLAGKDVGDNLGPVGKMSLGYSRLAGGGESSTTTEGDGDGDDRDDRGDDRDEANEIPGAEAV